MNPREVFEETIVNALVDPQYIFYGHIIAATKLKFDEDFPAPAGVYFHKKVFNLVLNPKLFNKYSLKERKGILVHEALHITLKHIGRIKNKDREIANIAADIAINQFIKDLPENSLRHEMFGLEEKLSFEIYYMQLRKQKDSMKFSKNEEGVSMVEVDLNSNSNQDEKDSDTNQEETKTSSKFYPIDPHFGEDLTDENEMIEVIDLTASEIVQNSMEKSKGLIPKSLIEMIQKLYSKKVNWKRFIRNGLSSPSIDVEETIKKRNRRFPDRIEIKGLTKIYSSEGVVILDTSGSMESNFIAKTLGEINHLCQSTDTKLHIIQIDAQVQEVKKYDPKSHEMGIKGRGGTHLYPAIEYIINNKIKHDFIVIITDGECESSWDVVHKSKYYFLLPSNCELNLDTSALNCNIFYI